MAKQRNRPPEPTFKTAIKFTRAHLGRDAFAPFTGQDHSAWMSFVYAMELWCRGDVAGMAGAIAAMKATLSTAQRSKTVHLLFAHAIPAVGDWHHLAAIWEHLDSPFVVGNTGDRILIASRDAFKPHPSEVTP